jgi:hypothetical protein
VDAFRDVLGTILLSVLAGHWRYAHISALRGDGVNPGLLGRTKVASEDSVRRGFFFFHGRQGGCKNTSKPVTSRYWKKLGR